MILSQLERWAERADALDHDAQSAKRAYVEESARLADLKANVQAIEQAQEIAQTIAADIQQKVHARIVTVVSRCLGAVFDDPYEFQIEFDRKRGRTEAILKFVRDGHELDPMSASGGGVVDVAALALRLASLMLSRPQLRRFLALDEPFKSPSAHYRQRVRELMETLSTEMGVQFLIVTNIEELEAGNIIRL